MTGVPRWRNSDPPWYDNQHLTIYDIPQIGTWVGRVGHVIDVWSNPCAADPEVWIYATWSNAPKLLLALFKPDRQDLVLKRFGGAHKRRPKRKFKIIEELNAKLPLPKGAGWAVFKLTGDLAQKVGWYMLVADATTEFAVNWTSTVYTLQGCRTPGAPYTRAIQTDGVHGPYEAGTYDLQIWHLEEAHIFSQDAERIAIPNGYEWASSVSFTTQPLDAPFLEASVASVSLVDTISEKVLQTTTMHKGYDNISYASLIHRNYGPFQPAANLVVRITKGEGLYRVGNSTFQSYGNKDNGLNPDP